MDCRGAIAPRNDEVFLNETQVLTKERNWCVRIIIKIILFIFIRKAAGYGWL